MDSREDNKNSRELLKKLLPSDLQISDHRNSIPEIWSALLAGVTPSHPLVTNPPPPPTAIQPPPPPMKMAATLHPAWIGMFQQIYYDLHSNPDRLLKLNPSRREAISDYLEFLDQGFGQQKTQLQNWALAPNGSTQEKIRNCFFEEVALFTMAQAFLLKRWGEFKLRTFKKDDLGKLNWELSAALKPQVPLNREGWNLTRPNIYSWYVPSPSVQQDLFHTLDSMPLTEVSSQLVIDLFTGVRRFGIFWPESMGYDPRFYQEVAKGLHHLQDLRIQENECDWRRRAVFTPTLRNGVALDWFSRGFSNDGKGLHLYGFESNPMLLYLAEFQALWNGPIAPPVWNCGFGFEALPKEQMSFMTPGFASPLPNLQKSTHKPACTSHLQEMESCDLSWVFEERLIKAGKLKHLYESIPALKKWKAPQASLGYYQAFVALSKLRPTAKMIWFRESSISLEEGGESISQLFSKGRLVAEVFLQNIQHQLPSRVPLFPKYISIWEREPNLEVRNASTPRRIWVQGSLRSHIEIPILLEDLFKAVSQKEWPTRPNWSIQVVSTLPPQREWQSNWPTAQERPESTLLDETNVPLLRLGDIATIRSHSSAPQWGQSGVPDRFIWLTQNDCKLIRSQEDLASGDSGFLIWTGSKYFLNLIYFYLRSTVARKWLDKHSKWSEAILKMLPIPHSLCHADLEKQLDEHSSFFAQKATLISSTKFSDQELFQWGSLNFSPVQKLSSLAIIFQEIESQQKRLDDLITPKGNIRWGRVVRLLPKESCAPMTQHPLVQLQGQLPLYSAILKKDRSKSGHPAITLTTENGVMVKIRIEGQILFDIIWDQINELVSPTWSELVQIVMAPRQNDHVIAIGQEVFNRFQELELKKSSLLQQWQLILEQEFPQL